MLSFVCCCLGVGDAAPVAAAEGSWELALVFGVGVRVDGEVRVWWWGGLRHALAQDALRWADECRCFWFGWRGGTWGEFGLGGLLRWWGLELGGEGVCLGSADLAHDGEVVGNFLGGSA